MKQKYCEIFRVDIDIDIPIDIGLRWSKWGKGPLYLSLGLDGAVIICLLSYTLSFSCLLFF